MFFITCYAFSIGPIAWIIVSEVFPLRLRGRGVAAATLAFGTLKFSRFAHFSVSAQSRGQFAHLHHLRRVLHLNPVLRALCDPGNQGA